MIAADKLMATLSKMIENFVKTHTPEESYALERKIDRIVKRVEKRAKERRKADAAVTREREAEAVENAQ